MYFQWYYRMTYLIFIFVKPGAHWRQTRQLPKLATNRQQSRLLSCCRYFWLCHRFVESLLSLAHSTLSTVSRLTLSPKLNMFYVQLSWLCWKWVIFVARMLNVFSNFLRQCVQGLSRHNGLCRISNSTLSPLCTGRKRSAYKQATCSL